MGPYRRQLAKHHHVKPYQNPEKKVNEEKRDSNLEGTLPFASTIQMVESPISMTLNAQIAIKTLGIDVLRELMTNVILPAAEASFTKEQKAEVELRFKARMIAAQEALVIRKNADGMDEKNTAKDKERLDSTGDATELVQEKSTRSGADKEINTKDESYDGDDSEEDESEEEEEPDLDPQELREVEGKIAYDSHKKSLRMQLKIFDQSVSMDWKDGWEEQEEMMRAIVTEIGKWCQDLFEIAFIKRVKLSETDECLQAMYDVMEELRQSDCRTEFDEGYYSLQIYHKKRRCYSVTTGMDLLVLFWRDLALTALTYKGRSFESFAENIVEELHSTGLFSQLKEIIRPEVVASASTNTAVEATNQSGVYQDHWYSEDMKVALPQLRKIVLDLQKSMKQAKRAKKQTRYAY